MRVEWVRARNVRNYAALEATLSPTWTVLVGPNGAGKTNLLETLLFGLRDVLIRGGWEGMIRDGEQEASLAVHLTSGDTWETRLLRREDTIVKSRTLNDRPRSAVTAMPFSVVLFLPEDDALLQYPAGRRRLMSRALLMLRPRYAEAARRFQQVLRQRNAFLRVSAHLPGTDADRLWESWTRALLDPLHMLWEERQTYTNFVRARSARILESLGGVAPAIDLRLSFGGIGVTDTVPTPDEIFQCFQERRGEERRLRTTLLGPHRDDLVIQAGSRTGVALLSRGQRRVLLLALHLLEGELAREERGSSPVYAFDDVYSELDADHRAALYTTLADEQVVLTSADPGALSSIAVGRTYAVHEGTLRLLPDDHDPAADTAARISTVLHTRVTS